MIFALDLLRERARVTPDREAIVSADTGERLTYAKLDARVDAAAAALLASGLGPGDRFGILAFNSIDYVALFFASGRVGTIVVPLSTRATAHELRQIARDCGMKTLFADEALAAIASEIGNLRVEPMPASNAAPPPGGSRQAAAHRAADPESVYCLLYTSGTTGKPKGVMIPRRQLYWNGYNTVVNWDLRETDISPVYTPIYHAGGIAAFMIPIFCAGGRIVLHRSFDVSQVWDTIVSERCTVVLGVPTIWKLLMDDARFATADLSAVRWFISGGAPLPRFVIDSYQRRGVVFKQGYGLTEVGVNCFTMTVEESFRKPGSIGRPMLFTEVRLVDESGKDVAPGEIGEILLRGSHVSLGYWEDRAATDAAYDGEGWFHTGDLARQDDEGFFTIAGRRKEMFISGGVNVYPAEIEGELVAHPAVSDAAIVAVADETWGEVGVAFVVGKDLSAEELTSYLTTKLAKYKLPREFVFLDALPRTPYGKVEKEKLRARLAGAS